MEPPPSYKRQLPMQIEQIAEMDLTTADDRAIGQLLNAAFSTAEFNGRSYFQNRHHLRVIARDGDAIIGHIALSIRAIRMGDTLLDSVGIAEVATHPDHRGKGIASALMEEALTAARATIADVCILFGDEKLYAGVGFQAKTNRTLTISMHNQRSGPQENRAGDKLMVLPLRDITWDDNALIDFIGFAF